MDDQSKWQFEDTGRDTWMWIVSHPDGTKAESAEEFRTLGECTANAMQHGYVVWKSDDERRRNTKLGVPVPDPLKR